MSARGLIRVFTEPFLPFFLSGRNPHSNAPIEKSTIRASKAAGTAPRRISLVS